jgi:NAD(P)-dependent dehydrogenase (short-subunit alcohol dehydrogenase family)
MNAPCKHALITGGASGLGKLHAEYLAKQGIHVAILDIYE